MYIAKMPFGSSVAKYFPMNNSMYFSTEMNFDNIDTLVIHECIHAIQEVKNSNGKLLRLGLYDLNKNVGEGINEAAVQLMAAKATENEKDNVKYYNMEFFTSSPIFYPVETALITQMMYFTGAYALFHSTIYSNDVFKNTFIAKSSKKVYNTIEKNFDLLIHYEEALSLKMDELSQYSSESKKSKKINEQIEHIKSRILDITISTQNLIIENGFNGEYNLIRDQYTLNVFRQKLYDFNELLINTEAYIFYNNFYCEMMNRLEEKSEWLKTNGRQAYLDNLQTDVLDLQKDNFSIAFFKKIFEKLKMLLGESVKGKNSE